MPTSHRTIHRTGHDERISSRELRARAKVRLVIAALALAGMAASVAAVTRTSLAVLPAGLLWAIALPLTIAGTWALKRSHRSQHTGRPSETSAGYADWLWRLALVVAVTLLIGSWVLWRIATTPTT